jgi:hypothetical protein
MYDGNFDIAKMLDHSNLRIQRCRLIFWVECSAGGYLVLPKPIVVLFLFQFIWLRAQMSFDS